MFTNIFTMIVPIISPQIF